MDITITLTFDKTSTPNASRMTRDQIKEAIEDAMLSSNFLDKIARRTGEKSSVDVPAWDFYA